MGNAVSKLFSDDKKKNEKQRMTYLQCLLNILTIYCVSRGVSDMCNSSSNTAGEHFVVSEEDIKVLEAIEAYNTVVLSDEEMTNVIKNVIMLVNNIYNTKCSRDALKLIITEFFNTEYKIASELKLAKKD